MLKKLLIVCLLLFAGNLQAQVVDSSKNGTGKSLEQIEAETVAFYGKLGIPNLVLQKFENPLVVQNLGLFLISEQWLGTRYRYGGMSYEGIDCSGFVLQILNEVYGVQQFPRNSAEMFSKTDPVNKNELQEGDLVFFRTRGRGISHVGIYIGEGKFVHSSTSSGVIISSLSESYYVSRFYKGGRLKPIIAPDATRLEATIPAN
jgi:lipoprotein Spr